VQVIGHRLVPGERVLPTVSGAALQLAVDPAAPLPEVVDLAGNLLLPGALAWGVSGKSGYSFFGRSGAFRGRAEVLDFDMRHHPG
jgi:hypothetical protein